MFCSKYKKVIVSQKIKEFRHKNQLTQSQFADLFGITAQSVSKWEREECYPDITFLPVLAEAIGCMIDEFFA
ncbi:MAG: helix-turn-helix transcriptional regulator [Ruminococcaceae bacterium]|nr:helix-turn-helix transcriptional regulator [Oscillospiraceae bacterium]MBQ7391630.1 helix-turn-helix transcriptional regulator [Clostridia bacterium]